MIISPIRVEHKKTTKQNHKQQKLGPYQQPQGLFKEHRTWDDLYKHWSTCVCVSGPASHKLSVAYFQSKPSKRSPDLKDWERAFKINFRAIYPIRMFKGHLKPFGCFSDLFGKAGIL